jgi:hypothetical protein
MGLAGQGMPASPHPNGEDTRLQGFVVLAVIKGYWL